jgi:glyoxylase-like metal-dependent hydrolase (beta-lactamase superfamily II)
MDNTLNRRTFVKLGALSATSLVATRDLSGMNSSFTFLSENQGEAYHFRVGDLECYCINDGGLDYDIELFFKNVPREQVESVLAEHELPIGPIYTPYTHLIVMDGERLILVDMGAGKALPNNGELPTTMASIGIEPSDIDTVIITHAHPDHIGGTLNDVGKPIYDNARYYMWKGEWDFWFSDVAFEKTNEFFTNTAREQLSPIKGRIDLLEEESEILPGVNIIEAPGHTPGHIVVSFSSRGEHLYYTADTVLYPLHLEYPDWLSVYDILPDEAEASKRKVFDLVARENALVIGQHFVPFPSLGHVVKTGKGWLFQPIEEQ